MMWQLPIASVSATKIFCVERPFRPWFRKFDSSSGESSWRASYLSLFLIFPGYKTKIYFWRDKKKENASPLNFEKRRFPFENSVAGLCCCCGTFWSSHIINLPAYLIFTQTNKDDDCTWTSARNSSSLSHQMIERKGFPFVIQLKCFTLISFWSRFFFKVFYWRGDSDSLEEIRS